MGKNIVPWDDPPTAKVIQYNSGDEVECRFECEVTTLMIEGDDVPASILSAPNILLLPSAVLGTGKGIATQEFLELIDSPNFEEEFGDGDSYSDSDDDIPELVHLDWFAEKIQAAKDAGCNEFEEKLLDSVINPGE